MKLGISSYTYTWAVGVPGSVPPAPLDELGLLEKARVLGVTLVQVADNLPLETFDDQRLERFGQAAARQGIGIEVGGNGLTEERLAAYLRIAGQLHSPILRMVADRKEYQPAPAELVRIIKKYSPELARRNITLALENYERLTVADFRQIIEQAGSPHAGICLDTVNSFGAAADPARVVELLGPLTVNLHIKDFNLRRPEHRMGFILEGTPAGRGRLHVPWLLEQLRSYHRDCNAILELWTPPEQNICDTVSKEDAWAAESVGYLRTLIKD